MLSLKEYDCMSDDLTKEQRRKNMQHIKSSDTQIEVLLRKALWKKGYRYRKNYKNLPGKPDIVLTKYRIAIFFMYTAPWYWGLDRVYYSIIIRYKVF